MLLVVILITGAGAVTAAAGSSFSPVSVFVTYPPTPNATVLARPIMMLLNDPLGELFHVTVNGKNFYESF